MIRYRLIIAATILTLAGAIGAAVTAPSHGAPEHQSAASRAMPKATWMTHPCAYEDSVNCFWNAGTSGNHRGHSFYVREVPGRAHIICVMYVTHRDQKRWDYCETSGANARSAPKMHDFDRDGFGE